ncbi:DUF3906 family protein [Paenactinomyces guangxiensis]|uniref:DUF3906 family protein n=1 Tax=Paenactinomyces guangxiensis TaxID=1490290 RepID=A0A7W1WMX6_9BACL|nr:DUF3906 family protein [Paenactinomyces guangxiensis]MBA4492780.1 DUF3906 family protein [Paenactinomyces guangxiensis]MBH8590371.1 DUF3906 family protein [Paenactinomyces guangxiensis]
MYLYRLEAEVEEKGIYHIIVLAPSDEKAFDYAEKELERYTIATPEVKEWVLEEKKRVRSGAGYVIE